MAVPNGIINTTFIMSKHISFLIIKSKAHKIYIN